MRTFEDPTSGATTPTANTQTASGGGGVLRTRPQQQQQFDQQLSQPQQQQKQQYQQYQQQYQQKYQQNYQQQQYQQPKYDDNNNNNNNDPGGNIDDRMNSKHTPNMNPDDDQDPYEHQPSQVRRRSSISTAAAAFFGWKCCCGNRRRGGGGTTTVGGDGRSIASGTTRRSGNLSSSMTCCFCGSWCFPNNNNNNNISIQSWIQQQSQTIVSSWIWTCIIIVFTVLLLFGSPIQFWLVPKDGDIVFDIMYMLGFVIFMVDIVLNCYADPEYFICDPCNRRKRRRNRSRRSKRGDSRNVSSTSSSGAAAGGGGEDAADTNNNNSNNKRLRFHYRPDKWTFSLGSYNFWCDLLSSGGFLYDVSFINLNEFSTPTTVIDLDPFGVPKNFADAVNSALPVEANLNFIVLVIKTARVARLVPSTKVVALSTRINLYWFFERLTIKFYIKLYKDRRDKRRRMKEDNEMRRGSSLVRKGSWGGLEIAAVAAVKQMQEEEKKKKTMGTRYVCYKLNKWAKQTLRFLHILPNTSSELNRQIAATKIQRAWRSRHVNQYARSEDGIHETSVDGSLMWSNRDSVSSSLKKRSTFRNQYLFGGGGGRSGGVGGGGSTRTASSRMLLRSQKNVMMTNGPQQSNNHPTSQDPNRRRLNHHTESDGRDGPKARSQVGTAMAKVTGQRVGVFILLSLLFVLVFTYYESDSTRASTMVVLHGQTIRAGNEILARRAVEAARFRVLPSIYSFESYATRSNVSLSLEWNVSDDGSLDYYDIDGLRDREKQAIIVENGSGRVEGYFVIRQQQIQNAQVELLATVFVLLLWFFGVAAFAGPIMTFVIIPIERMIRLLGMLMVDPLGYQSNLRYKKFLLEENEIVKKSQWTKEILKGMETSFLMATILRIGSLMKVGFGSAGVEIIRNNLQKGQSKNMLILNSQGTPVSCIFLFCDIRQFTDATECLQEEVFVFTNRIAEVVHSICHSYGGSANKNVGDAFLVSWQLEDESNGFGRFTASRNSETFLAKHHQADKALLSVVKICIALHHDEYYVQTMSHIPRTSLLKKLEDRPGPVVQMGFGLHAGKAVQGAIGSQRKIDATYVSEAVQRAEYLETSTKKYKVPMLMSNSFYGLLHLSNRRRCRKIDQIMFINEDEDDYEYEEELLGRGDVMELYTYDLHVDALWEDVKKEGDADHSVDSEDSVSPAAPPPIPAMTSLRSSSSRTFLKNSRRISMRTFDPKSASGGEDTGRSGSVSTLGQNDNGQAPSTFVAAAAKVMGGSPSPGYNNTPGGGLNEDMKDSTTQGQDEKESKGGVPELVLPTGPALYSNNIWSQSDMRRIRRRYSPGVLSKYSYGLKKYYEGDWDTARQCFESVLERFDDGPSHYFLDEMAKHGGIPPHNFEQYGRA